MVRERRTLGQKGLHKSISHVKRLQNSENLTVLFLVQIRKVWCFFLENVRKIQTHSLVLVIPSVALVVYAFCHQIAELLLKSFYDLDGFTF